MHTIALAPSPSIAAHLRSAVASVEIVSRGDELQVMLGRSPDACLILQAGSADSAMLAATALLYPTAVISEKPHFDEGFALLKQGIKAYANCYMGAVHYAQMLETMRSGNVWLYPDFMQQLIAHAVALPQAVPQSPAIAQLLTAREYEIALLVTEQMSNQEIAEKTGITVRTVKQHMTNIFEKLQIKDRLSLALMMRR